MNIKFFRSSLLLLFLSFGLIYFAGCDNELTPSFYDSNDSEGPTPKINSVEPESRAIAAVTPITITGENFMSDSSAVKVYFGAQYGEILSVTPTQLSVISPNLKGPLEIRISTNQAVQFSNSYDYYLEPATIDFYPLPGDEDNVPVTITVDNNENVFSSNSGLGVVKIMQDSSSELYSPRAGETYFTSIRFGSDGTLYGARGLYAVFAIPPGGGVKNSPYYLLPSRDTKISKLEFDPMGNLWAGGANDSLYRINSDESHAAFPFSYVVTAMRIFVDNGTPYLYVAAGENDAITIKRLPISEDGDLGAEENYFDFSAEYGAEYSVNDIEFAADGEMYLATNMADPIVYVGKDKSTGVLYPHILLESPALSLAWGTGEYLYYVREKISDASGAVSVPQTVVKVNLMKQGAPHYGM